MIVCVHLCAYTITIWFSCSRFVHSHTYDPFECRPCWRNSHLLITLSPHIFFSPSFSLTRILMLCSISHLVHHIHLRQINTFSFRLVYAVFTSATTYNLFIHIFILILFHLPLLSGGRRRCRKYCCCWIFLLHFLCANFVFAIHSRPRLIIFLPFSVSFFALTPVFSGLAYDYLQLILYFVHTHENYSLWCVHRSP